MTCRGDPATDQVFEFFASCGGANCGFRAAGAEIRFEPDHDTDARVSFEGNFPDRTSSLQVSEMCVEMVRLRVKAGRPKLVLM